MRIRLAFCATLLPISIWAQALAPGSPAVMLSGRGGILNEPYSAEVVTTQLQTLADGTHITQTTTTVKMFRDSSSRTRTERTMGVHQLLNGSPPPVMITINDPVSGYSYTLDPAAKIARRMATSKAPTGLGTPPAPPASFQPPPSSRLGAISTTQPAKDNPLRPQSKSEDLGTQTMEGLVVNGHRNTITYPVGAIGNDREIMVTNEIWTNPELRLMILQKSSDPRTGERVTKMQNLSRAEPDPALFMPPADYEIKDMARSQ